MLCTLLLLFPSLGAALPAAGQDAHTGSSPQALERWQQHTPEERAALRERFEAFRQMDEEHQAELRSRLERLREAEQRVRRSLDPEMQAQLERLPPEERREFLRGHLEREFSRCGRRVGELLAPELRERLEQATPEERLGLMKQMRSRFSGEKLARGLQELGRRLELPPEQLAALAELGPEEGRAKLLELRRRELVERVEREGPPEWIGHRRWEEWRGLDDREFCQRLHGEGGTRRGEEEGELGGLLRPDPLWLEEIVGLEPTQRRAEIERRLAARYLEHLEGHPGAVAPAELERLRGLGAAELVRDLRERQRAERGGHGRSRRSRGHGAPPADRDR